MTGRTKIVDEQEVLRWFEEGKTYAKMVELYRTKYNIEIGISAFGNFRRRRGLDRRHVRNDALLPWQMKEEHRLLYPAVNLRAEARRRAGVELDDKMQRQLDAFKQRLAEADAVLHYDPDTEQGWWWVKRREGIDLDMIREPDRRTTKQPNRDGQPGNRPGVGSAVVVGGNVLHRVGLPSPMTPEDWVAKHAAAHPPLTPRQLENLAVLRRIADEELRSKDPSTDGSAKPVK